MAEAASSNQVNRFCPGQAKMVSRQAETIFRWTCVSFILFFLAIGVLHSHAVSGIKAPERLVAVGDVHGDFDDFCLILKRMNLVDGQAHWIGGMATLVQTGDLIDRGPKSRDAMNLLMRLETEAATAGGQVVPLLGNHEVMNILGDLRYVSPQDYASFADNDSEKRRKAAYQEYAAWYAKHAKFLAGLKQPKLPTTEEEWMAIHPPGFLEQREAFSADGIYGKWLRHHVAVVNIGRVLFLHGGISPNSASLPVEQINLQIHKEIEEFDETKHDLVARKVILEFFTIQEIAVAVQAELHPEHPEAQTDPEYQKRLERLASVNNWLCVRVDGPLWFRGYDEWSDEEGPAQIEKILSAYDARHIVVAHTVQKAGHIRSRFGGKLFLIDTGMLSTYWHGGSASALEIRAGKFTAQYPDGQELLFDEKPPVPGGTGN